MNFVPPFFRDRTVAVAGEDVHNVSVRLKLLLCPHWGAFRNSGIEGVKVDECVDTSSVESSHTAIVVRPRVDVVYLWG